MTDVILGDDGRARCAWSAKDADYRSYHDIEWGTPLRGDRPLFEKICLEGFQAGLSWITILKRREGFRDAFAGFDPERVASFGDADIERLMGDERIIRNRAKVLATIGNAQALLELLTTQGEGALDRLIWSFAPEATRSRPTTMSQIPAVTLESEALSTALRTIGFRFVGPTTMYALMQSAGLVDDHVAGCWRSQRAA